MLRYYFSSFCSRSHRRGATGAGRGCAARMLIAGLCAATFVAVIGPSAVLASSWSAPRSIGLAGGGAVSCPSESFCAAVDSNGNAKTYNGHSWSTLTLLATNGHGLAAVSCSSPSFCVAVGGGMLAFTYNGHSWSTPYTIALPAEDTFLGSLGDGLLSVSCASASFCVAADGLGNAFAYNGQTWNLSLLSYTGVTSGNAVSCSSSSFCTLINGANNGVSSENYDGISWTNHPYISVGYSHNGASEISCVSAPFCAVVGDDGSASVYNGSSWVPTGVSNSMFNSVSCATTSFCVAVDQAGNAYTYNGTSWSAPARIDSSSEPISVSCASASFCVVVAEALSGHYSDYAVTYSTATPPRTHHAKRPRCRRTRKRRCTHK